MRDIHTVFTFKHCAFHLYVLKSNQNNQGNHIHPAKETNMITATQDEKTNFTMTTDRRTRDEFHRLCEGIGISMSSALNAFMKQAIRQQSMSFTLLDENGFAPEEAAELKRRRFEVESGNYQQHELIES